MYKVVLFDSEEVEVVPGSWVEESNGSTVCYWPPYSKPSAFFKAVRQHKPREDTWGVHRVRCLFETEDIDKANKKRREAEELSNLSDLQSSVSDVEKTKRRERKRIRASSFSSDSGDEHQPCRKAKTLSKSCSSKSGNHADRNRLLPIPPKVPAELISSSHSLSGSSGICYHSPAAMARQAAVESSACGTATASSAHSADASINPTIDIQVMQAKSTPNLPRLPVSLLDSSTPRRTCTTGAINKSPRPQRSSAVRANLHSSPIEDSPAARSTAQSPRPQRSSAVRGNLHSSPVEDSPVARSTAQSPRPQRSSAVRGNLHSSPVEDSPVARSTAQSPRPQRSSVSTRMTKAFQPESAVVRMLVQQHAEAKEQLRIITTLLQDILRRQRSTDTSHRGRLPDSLQLPLKNYAALQQLEQQLESQELHNQLAGYLASIGGVTIKQCAGRILTALLKHELALQLTWCGRNTEKHSFGDMKLSKVVIDAVRRNALTSAATHREIEQEIKVWFNRAADRCGGRSERGEIANRRRRLLSDRAQPRDV